MDCYPYINRCSILHREKEIGKEITVYKNEKYDHEVFKTNDYRIEF